nr:MAG TPA: Spectrin beta chain, erythrocyte, Ankyrin-1, spectrin, spectrin repeat, three.75A [Caudoviricetes sp.]
MRAHVKKRNFPKYFLIGSRLLEPLRRNGCRGQKKILGNHFP